MNMKRYFTLLIAASLAHVCYSQAVPNSQVRTAKTEAGFRIFQFTYGAVERCKLASSESSQAYDIQLARLKADFPKLVQSVAESPNHSWYKEELDRVMKSLPQDTQSATGDCRAFTYLLKTSLDDPIGRKTLEHFTDILSN
jgi:hypothetical protein